MKTTRLLSVLFMGCTMSLFGAYVLEGTTSGKYADATGMTAVRRLTAYPYTIELWVNPAQSRSQNFMVGQHHSSPGRFVFGIDNGKLSHFMDGYGTHISVVDVPNNAWSHVACVCTTNTVKFYLNGELGETFEFTPDANCVPGNTAISVGSYRCGYIQEKNNTKGFITFLGKMAEIRVWNIERSETEIAGAMNRRLTGNENGLFAYWPIRDIEWGCTPEYTTGQPCSPGTYQRYVEDATFPDLVDAPRGSIKGDYPVFSAEKTTNNTDYSFDTGYTLPSTGDFTIEMWVNIPSTSNPRQNTMVHQYKGSTKGRASFELYDGCPRVWQNSSKPDTVSVPAPIPIGEWVHLAYVRDYGNGHFLIYTNGVVAIDQAMTFFQPMIANYTCKLFWMTDSASFAGKMRELRIWNTARSAEQITADMYRQLNGNEDGLQRCYHLSDAVETLQDAVTGEKKAFATDKCSWVRADRQWLARPSGWTLQPSFDGGYTTAVETKTRIVTTNFTVEAWVCPYRPSVGTGMELQCFAQYKGNSDPSRFCFGMNYFRRPFFFMSGSTLQSKDVFVPYGCWSHLAGVKDGTNVTVYLNGEQVASGSDEAWAGAPGETDMLLGVQGRFVDFQDNGTGSTPNGAMREARMWSYARTAEQIAENYRRRISPREEGLIGQWYLDADDDLTTLISHRYGVDNGDMRLILAPLPPLPEIAGPLNNGTMILIK